MKFKTKYNVGDVVETPRGRIFVVQDILISFRSGETIVQYFDHSNLHHTEMSLKPVHQAPRNSIFALSRTKA